MDETAVIAAVLAGDADAYEHLVARYHVGLIIVCERWVGDRQTAEDLAQEAFIKAYQHLHSFDASKAAFSTWLYKIATNRTMDYLRSQKRDLPHEDVDALAEAAAPDYAAEEELRQLRDAVRRLQPPSYRKVIEAYYWKGLSYQEIANSLGLPLNTVRTQLRRAKQQLRSDLS